MRDLGITVDELNRRVMDLPPISHTYMRILQVVDNPETRSNTLAQAIEADPAFVASLLKIANSAFYARPNGIASIPEAIMTIGTREIKRMCLALFTRGGLIDAPEGPRRFDRKRFWRHCVGTAYLAEALAVRLRRADVEAAFTHGLLHGLGILALDSAVPEHFDRLLAISGDMARPLAEVEMELLGLTHARIGGELAHKWKFPKPLQRSIESFAAPVTKPDLEIATIVHLACGFEESHELCQSCSIEDLEAESKLGIGLTRVELWVVRGAAQQRLEQAMDLFDL